MPWGWKNDFPTASDLNKEGRCDVRGDRSNHHIQHHNSMSSSSSIYGIYSTIIIINNIIPEVDHVAAVLHHALEHVLHEVT